MNCGICGAIIPASATGRPRRYCSPACKQRAYRARQAMAGHPDGPGGQLGSLAGRLRDNADLIMLLCQGWTPPAQAAGVTLERLLVETSQLAGQLGEAAALLADGPAVVDPPAVT